MNFGKRLQKNMKKVRFKKFYLIPGGLSVVGLSIVIVSALSLTTVSYANPAGIRRVWAVDDGERIKRDDLNHPLASSLNNPVWHGHTIHLFGAKNEIVAFQLIIESDNSGVNDVDVTLDSLTSGSYTIQNTGSSDPFDYVGKRIELFTEHYLNIENRTGTSGKWWWNARPKDIHGDEYLGWIPDVLIPFEAPSGLGGAPFDIAPNNNQGVWVDIYIPRDAPAGSYTGSLKLSVDSRITDDIPVSLQVHNFALPDETHFKNFFYGDWYGIAQKHDVTYPSSQYYEIEGRYHQMAHRHRFDLSFNGDLDHMKNHYRRYITGEYYTKEHGYEGPGENVGHGTYSIGTYDQDRSSNAGRASGFQPNNEQGWRAASDAWVTWFNQNAPAVEIFKYMRDEVYAQESKNEWDNAVNKIRTKCDWIHNNPGPGKELLILATTQGVAGRPRTDFEGYIDFWQTGAQAGYEQDGIVLGYVVNAARELQSKGNKVGFYNGTRPSSGTEVIDTDAIDFRVIPWISWKYDVDQYFLWHVNYFYQGSRHINPFKDNYRVYDGRYAYGGGTFFYPGEDKEFPQDDRGLRGPIASIRMKNWQRGQQDYEYLWLAEQAGLHSEIQDIVNTVVPKALSECDSHNAPAPWAVRGYIYEQQRKQLAQLIGEIAEPTCTNNDDRGY